MSLRLLLQNISDCQICIDKPRGNPLPHVPRPILRVSKSARLAIAGQAPGTRVHASGKPFTDPSGDRLRDWMGVTEQEFYDTRHIAIIPMGFCFPGLDAHGGDLPPRKECAAAWRAPLFELLPNLELVFACWPLCTALASGFAPQENTNGNGCQLAALYETDG